MLAGRKILLADDSITIQKVVELSFVDEGAEVVYVSNGKEAIERLENFQPDIVLADVFMPQVNGYELCEYIKQNEKLKHIPVMLLVGSFEPFNESEARRVGADDTLTKPFQSIRRLLEKVGLLAEQAAPEEMIQTAEYPRVDQPEPQKLSDREIELTTADTRQLQPVFPQAAEPVAESAPTSKPDDAKMEPKVTDVRPQQQRTDAREELLDLGDLQPPASASTEEFVLDIDLDTIPEAPATDRYPAYAGRPELPTTIRDLRFAGREATATVAPHVEHGLSESSDWKDQVASGPDFPQDFAKTDTQPISPESVASDESKSSASSGMITLDQLSPEVIDAIARRAVEKLSEKVVQEVAWEVVPQLAELLIKRQLEEKSS